MAWKPYFELNLLDMGLLHMGWADDILALSNREGRRTVLTGEGSTSREPSSGQAIVVHVVEGDVVKAKLPWLWALYRGPLLEFASHSFAKHLYPAQQDRSAVNINHLRGKGARYEWHVDSNPVTGLLFCTEGGQGVGGSLVFIGPVGERAIVRPKAGTFICFDARSLPHRVAPLRKDVDRISVPMNYYDSPSDQPRPSDLDGLIYA